MEKELVDIVIEKEFGQMTASEKLDLQEWCASEEEFDQLKQVFIGIEQLKISQQLTPRAETKRSLDDLFAQQHTKPRPVFWNSVVLVAIYPTHKPFVRRPLVQIAAIGLIFLLVFPFVNSRKLTDVNIQVAQVDEIKSTEKTKTVSEVKSAEEIKIEEAPSVITTRSIDVPPVAAFAEDLSVVSSGVATSSSAEMSAPASLGFKSDHPDGIFTGESSVAYSQPASAQPAIFDLLTATF